MSERLYEPIKCEFEPEDLRKLGEELAKNEQLLRDTRAQKIAAAARFTGDIKTLDKRIAELTDKINNGFEIRDVECMALMDDPRPGQKTIVRLDTNKPHRIEMMTAAEMQRSFGFSEGGGK